MSTSHFKYDVFSLVNSKVRKSVDKPRFEQKSSSVNLDSGFTEASVSNNSFPLLWSHKFLIVSQLKCSNFFNSSEFQPINEWHLLFRFSSHANIISIHGANQESMALVLEFADCGSLHKVFLSIQNSWGIEFSLKAPLTKDFWFS